LRISLVKDGIRNTRRSIHVGVDTKTSTGKGNKETCNPRDRRTVVLLEEEPVQSLDFARRGSHVEETVDSGAGMA
jgi:hypothetical protein